MITTPASIAFGKRLKDERLAQGLSQQELGKAAGCSQRLISELERGKASVELGKAIAVAEALGLAVRLDHAPKSPAVPKLVDYL